MRTAPDHWPPLHVASPSDEAARPCLPRIACCHPSASGGPRRRWARRRRPDGRAPSRARPRRPPRRPAGRSHAGSEFAASLPVAYEPPSIHRDGRRDRLLVWHATAWIGGFLGPAGGVAAERGPFRVLESADATRRRRQFGGLALLPISRRSIARWYRRSRDTCCRSERARRPSRPSAWPFSPSCSPAAPPATSAPRRPSGDWAARRSVGSSRPPPAVGALASRPE